ncbi:MAG: AAA family ATPase [Nakamurella sp.]
MIVCGLPGSGKTTLAIRLVDERNGLCLGPDDWMDALGVNLWESTTRDLDMLRKLGCGREVRTRPAVRVRRGPSAGWARDSVARRPPGFARRAEGPDTRRGSHSRIDCGSLPRSVGSQDSQLTSKRSDHSRRATLST